MDGSTIRNFVIKDYADTDIRGFIEGYYGIPWSNEDRMSLMKFGGEFQNDFLMYLHLKMIHIIKIYGVNYILKRNSQPLRKWFK